MPLKPPPRDAQGVVIPHDHDEIYSDDQIIRRISELQLVDDKKTGGRRISSLAFNPSAGPNGGAISRSEAPNRGSRPRCPSICD